MTKWALWAVAGFVGCSLSASAQELDLLALNQSGRSAANSPAALFSGLNGANYRLPVVALTDARPISLLNGYNWIDATTPDFLPEVSAEAPATRVRPDARTLRDPTDKVVAVKPNFFDYVGGEVGVLYGHSAGGKFSGDVEQGYILGEIGNDKTHISVGAFYEQSNGHGPHH